MAKLVVRAMHVPCPLMFPGFSPAGKTLPPTVNVKVFGFALRDESARVKASKALTTPPEETLSFSPSTFVTEVEI